MFLIKVRFRTLSNNNASQSVAPVQRKKNERWQGWACWREKEGHWGRCKHNQVFPHAIVLQKLWSQSCTPVLSFNVLCFKFVTGKGKWSHFLWKCWCLWSLTFFILPIASCDCSLACCWISSFTSHPYNTDWVSRFKTQYNNASEFGRFVWLHIIF